MQTLQDPKHIVPDQIIGLMLSEGWNVAYNDTQDPYIRHVSGHYSTYSTWWDCLKELIESASDPT